MTFCSFMRLCELCRLREWYHALLRQAKQEGIVTYISNLYDTFFEGGKDHRVERPSATHLPYFEGAPESRLCVARRLHPFSSTRLDVCRDASVQWARCHSVLTCPESLQVTTGLGRLRRCWPTMRSSSDRLAATGRAAQPLERHVASRTPR